MTLKDSKLSSVPHSTQLTPVLAPPSWAERGTELWLEIFLNPILGAFGMYVGWGGVGKFTLPSNF